jgi:hypothetical protein
MKIFKWFKETGVAIKIVNYLDGIIKKFPNINQKKLDYILSKREYWIEEKETIKKRIIDGYSKNIDVENYKELSQKYIDFYQTVFPNENGEEIKTLISVNELEEFVLKRINDDDALDPNEIAEIKTKCIEMGLSEYDNDEKIRTKFEYFVINGELDNGIFPNIAPDFILNKNEQCLYRKENVELNERKQVTKRINYSGPRARIKIVKGLSYNIGSYNFSTQKEMQDVFKGKGIINITTKRILFKSPEKKLTIRHSAIIDIETFSNAIIISKSTGNPLIFRTEDAIKLYQYLNGAIRNL